MKSITLAVMLLISIIGSAQNVVNGRVIDGFDQPIPGVSVTVKGTSASTITDFDGNFTLTTDEDYPFTLEAKSIGFDDGVLVVTSETNEVTIVLDDITFLDELVISASRAPERLFESPVSIERYGVKEIRNAASADFYGDLENIKGVDVNTNSLTLKSINTRGFATFTNTRFVQLIDGMDNTAPALNFVLGNLVGMSELDVNSIELLPGASSALYGANAFNGILFMTSKNPFDHQGISTYAKGGITSQEAAGDNQFIDYGIRMAHAFSDKFAAKASFSFIRGTDWLAADKQDLDNPGATRLDPSYNGVNVYGDDFGVPLQSLALQAGLTPAQIAGLGIPDIDITRTGYDEADLNDNKVESLKFDAALHYRPFADDFEIIYAGKVGRGTTVTQDANRTSLRNFILQQHKLEFKNDNFFVRGYVTAEDARDSYDIRFTGININNVWKSNTDWFTDYIQNYLGVLTGTTLGNDEAHRLAREAADTGRLIPGTPEFQQAFDQVTSNPDLSEGSKFTEKSQFRHADANYNFSHITSDFADIQVGGSFREYKLNSSGTVFTDINGPIKYSEFGVYTQIQKKLLDDRLKLTGSVRYDKSQLFDGNFSPRFSVGYTLGANRNRNLRASVQTGFRNPTTQDLYIGLDIGASTLIGSAPDNLDRYTDEIFGNTVTGRDAYENSFSASSVAAGAPVAANIDIVKPEKITAYEVGYRAQFGNFIIDASAYYNQYQDFISNEEVIVPLVGSVNGTAAEQAAAINAAFSPQTSRAFTASTNSDVDINSYGAVAGFTTKFKGFDLGANYTFAEQDFDKEQDPDFRSNFNTPKHKVKASIGKENLFNNFGFNTNFVWSDEYFWESDFGDGDIPSYTILNAQINYTIPALKTRLKVGANNIGGDEYFTAIGSGFIGSQYYIGLSINNL
ncbi:TonB-dependent receptor [Aquimarina sp. AU474]|uniref:TonB-dependent receptor n=1 Tax=Aquimarina sp. AU474 TaxID=2108529 RepID=UPI000D69E66F|nr:TonB-dependent receptor [Aquimarina sp. AU474]